MLINDLIERLHELKREYGSQEVTLYTQRDAWSWEEYDVDKVYHDDGDNLIVIGGKEKTGGKEWNPKEKFIPFRYLCELTDAGIEVGKVISIRNKNYDAVITNVLVTEINYNPEDSEVIDITLGATGYEFSTLFNSYQFQINGEWRPFGVEE